MGPLVAKCKGKQVGKWSGDPEDNVLDDEELEKCVEGVKYDQPFFVQRRNVLVLGNATGYRGEVIKRLLVESVKPTTLGTKKAFTIAVATMKNIPGGLNEGDKKLFTLLITEAEKPLVCPVRAIESQLALLKKYAEPTPKDEPCLM